MTNIACEWANKCWRGYEGECIANEITLRVRNVEGKGELLMCCKFLPKKEDKLNESKEMMKWK